MENTTMCTTHDLFPADYEIGDFLGQGTFADVWKGKSKFSDQVFAFKIPKLLVYNTMVSNEDVNSPTLIVRHSGIAASKKTSHLTKENVFWLEKPYSDIIWSLCAAFKFEDKFYSLCLGKCIEVWGFSPFHDVDGNIITNPTLESIDNYQTISNLDGTTYDIPIVPYYYHNWLKNRYLFLTEVRVLRVIGSHPNVVQFYDILENIQETHSAYFLQFEYSRGGDLGKLIAKKGRLLEKVAKVFFRKLISTIEYLHKRNVFHIDLNPNNILLKYSTTIEDLCNDNFHMEKDDFIAIADFGLALSLDRVNPDNHHTNNYLRIKKHCCTPGYRAPEVGAQGPYDPCKLDMFSLGCTLFAVVTGGPPFDTDEGESPFSEFKGWVNSDFQPTKVHGAKKWHRSEFITYPTDYFPVYLSAEVKNLLTLLLHPDPNERLFCSDGILDHPWFSDPISDVNEGSDRSGTGTMIPGRGNPRSEDSSPDIGGDISGDRSPYLTEDTLSSNNIMSTMIGQKRGRDGNENMERIVTVKIPDYLICGRVYGKPNTNGHFTFKSINLDEMFPPQQKDTPFPLKKQYLQFCQHTAANTSPESTTTTVSDKSLTELDESSAIKINQFFEQEASNGLRS